MFSKPGLPTLPKRIVYQMLVIILCSLLGLLLHAWIEMSYLSRAASAGRVVNFYGSCALTPALSAGIWILSIVGGYFLGRFWWRWLYVDRKWEKFK